MPTRRSIAFLLSGILSFTTPLLVADGQQDKGTTPSKRAKATQGRTVVPTQPNRGRNAFKVCWFPFPRGTTANCAQGPFGTGTHRNGYYWDFVLPEGTAILSPADGQVILVVDDGKVTGIRPAGTNPEQIKQYQQISMANSNQLAIDHGDGIYSFLWHHKAGTARVRPGDIVAAGSHIADVGMSGTYIPHICFSFRSPTKSECWDVRFRSDKDEPIEVRTGQQCLSETEESKERPKNFQASVVKGDEFKANGVDVTGGASLFFLPTDRGLTYEGRILEPATKVGFYLWQAGQTSEFIQTAVPDASGRFRLTVRIPQSSRGVRYYTIAITKPNGTVMYPSSSIALVQ